MKKIKAIYVLTHDAGSSEIFASLIKSEKKFRWTVFTYRNSPGEKIMRRNASLSLRYIDEEDISDIIKEKPGVLFFGTSWIKKDYSIASRFRRSGIPTIAFLEHWVDFRERFGYPAKKWKENLPDLVAVGDSAAYHLARSFFPRVAKINNYYLLQIKKDYEKIKIKPNGELLFISETAAQSGRLNTFTYNDKKERGVLEAILRIFPKLSNIMAVSNLTIRLHPSQTDGSLFDIFKKRYPDITIRVEKSDQKLLETIKRARMVVGLKGMALFISFLVGKPCFSFLKNRVLPLPEGFYVGSAGELLKKFPSVVNRSKLLYTNHPLKTLLKQL